MYKYNRTIAPWQAMLTTTIVPNLPIHPRFVMVNILRASDFGWEYLVKDCEQPGRLWVLEEFLPSAETPADLTIVQAAWRSELEPLQDLAHPQLPQSKEILSIDQRLFWLREYVAGRSLRSLLEERLEAGVAFDEAEVRAILLAILPLLQYLDDHGIAHGAIDLDAIVQRETDGLITLNRFGQIRDLGLADHFYLLQPLESRAWNTSETGLTRDLYDLAGVTLALLVGESPAMGLDQLFELARPIASPDFLAILQQMAFPKAWQRFNSPNAVMAALSVATQSLQASIQQQSERLKPTTPPVTRSSRQSANPPTIDPIIIGLSVLLLGLLSFLGWRVMARVKPTPQATVKNATKPIITSTVPPDDAMQSQRPNPTPQESLSVGGDWLSQIQQTADASQIAVVQPLLKQLSEEARRELGTYYRRDYDRWLSTLASRKISQPTVDILADTSFYLRFPKLKNQELNPRGFGQLWYALARDHITALNQQQNLEVLKVGPFTQSGKLTNGEGRVFQVQAKPGQQVKFELSGDRANFQVSVLENEILLLRKADMQAWQSPRSRHGAVYEIVLTPKQLSSIHYSIRLRGS
jgi:serine/threonine-protein kinase